MTLNALTALAERTAPRRAHVQINKPRGAMLRSWRIIVTAEIDRLCAEDDGVAEYWLRGCGDGIRLDVESSEHVNAYTLANSIADAARKHARRVMS